MNKFESFIVKIGHVITWPFVHADKLITTLMTCLKDEPGVKIAVVGLVQHIVDLSKDGTIAFAAKGLDIPDDIATAHAGKNLLMYVTTVFLPAIESAYKDIVGDVSAPLAGIPASDLSAAQPGPGLHTVTAA
jgi:hypothetical protein